jgi:hypothetical protein
MTSASGRIMRSTGCSNGSSTRIIIELRVPPLAFPSILTCVILGPRGQNCGSRSSSVPIVTVSNNEVSDGATGRVGRRLARPL